jgi:signal transduction histidine kinase
MEVMDFNKATAVFIKEMYNKQVQTGKCVLDYINPEYRNEFMTCINRAFLGKRSRKEVLLKYEGKSPIWWNIFLEPVRDENGKVINVVYNATNINDQKQRIAEITAQNEMLTNIAYIQSHEYRRPVASILGLMELIKIDSHNEPLSEYLAMMERAVNELDEKIKNVVSYVPR